MGTDVVSIVVYVSVAIREAQKSAVAEFNNNAISIAYDGKTYNQLDTHGKVKIKKLKDVYIVTVIR